MVRRWLCAVRTQEVWGRASTTRSVTISETRASIEHCREERVIPPTISGGQVKCSEHCLNLIEFKVFDRTGTRTLERNRKNALAQLNSVGMLCGTVPEESVNRGEAHISGRRYIVPLDFKVLKEIQYHRRTEILDIQLDHRAPPLRGNEPQQQDERITIALDGLRTGLTYPRKVIGEEST
jgi:hypothetical protein